MYHDRDPPRAVSEDLKFSLTDIISRVSLTRSVGAVEKVELRCSAEGINMVKRRSQKLKSTWHTRDINVCIYSQTFRSEPRRRYGAIKVYNHERRRFENHVFKYSTWGKNTPDPLFNCFRFMCNAYVNQFGLPDGRSSQGLQRPQPKQAWADACIEGPSDESSDEWDSPNIDLDFGYRTVSPTESDTCSIDLSLEEGGYLTVSSIMG